MRGDNATRRAIDNMIGAARRAMDNVIGATADELIMRDLSTEQLIAMYAEEDARQMELHEHGTDEDTAQEYLRTVLRKRAISKIINERRRGGGISEKS